mgnify:CR=1 FL=1
MSLVSGLRSGIRSGLRSGLNPSDGADPLAGLVTRDATSLVYCPADATEWASFISYHVGIATPDFPNVTVAGVYLCQEASGNLTDSIGGVTLTANGTPLYQQTVSGWTRKGVGFNATANQRFTAAATIGPNPTTTSQAWFFDMSSTVAPATTNICISISDGVTNHRLMGNNTPRIQVAIAGVTTIGASDPSGAGIQAMDLQYDRTNGRATGHTTQDKIIGTYSALVVDGRKGLGGVVSVTGQCVYGFRLEGANAEITDANIKAIQVARGHNILWVP